VLYLSNKEGDWSFKVKIFLLGAFVAASFDMSCSSSPFVLDIGVVRNRGGIECRTSSQLFGNCIERPSYTMNSP
jgi:hypothetical protein